MVVSALCERAAQELNLVMAGESLSANDGALILGKLNRLFDNWNTERQAIYRSVLTPFTLVPSTQPHTIGPSGATFTAVRPVSIDAASLILAGSGAKISIRVRSLAWWQSLSLPSLTSTIPTDLYYDPTFPNGSIYLYPAPTSDYGIELQMRLQFAAVALADVVTYPPGYEDAIILTLAEAISVPMAREVPPSLEVAARKARARIYAVNDVTPRLVTADAGMPGRVSGGDSYLNPYGL